MAQTKRQKVIELSLCLSVRLFHMDIKWAMIPSEACVNSNDICFYKVAGLGRCAVKLIQYKGSKLYPPIQCWSV